MHRRSIFPPWIQESPISLSKERQPQPESPISFSLRPSFDCLQTNISRAAERLETCCRGLFAFERYVAAVRFDRPAGNRQARPAPPHSRVRACQPVEAIKDVRLMLARNSSSMVDHV